MIWSSFTQLSGATLLIIGALLPIVNPLGDAPIFLAMTLGCDEITRAELAKRISLYSFCLLLGSMMFGSFFLRMFDLSIPVVQVAGGCCGVCAWLESPGRQAKTIRCDGKSDPRQSHRAGTGVLPADLAVVNRRRGSFSRDHRRRQSFAQG